MDMDVDANQFSTGMRRDENNNGPDENKNIPNPHAEDIEKRQDSFLRSLPTNSNSSSATVSVSGNKNSRRGRHVRAVSISSPQAFNSNTIPQQRIPNDRRRKLEEIHVICLNAAQSYIQEFRTNAQAYMPWLAAKFPQSKATTFHQQAIEKLCWEHELSESLKENVSTINSIFWEHGRLRRVLEPGAEKRALNAMQCLSDTSETLLKYASARDAELGVLYLDMINAGCDFCRCLKDTTAEARLKAKPLFLSMA